MDTTASRALENPPLSRRGRICFYFVSRHLGLPLFFSVEDSQCVFFFESVHKSDYFWRNCLSDFFCHGDNVNRLGRKKTWGAALEKPAPLGVPRISGRDFSLYLH